MVIIMLYRHFVMLLCFHDQDNNMFSYRMHDVQYEAMLRVIDYMFIKYIELFTVFTDVQPEVL